MQHAAAKEAREQRDEAIAEVERLEGARALLLQTLDGALGHLDAVALALGLELPEDDAAFRSDIVADCLLDHARGVVKRAEKAEAERDALQRRVDAGLALADEHDDPYEGYRVRVHLIRAALEAVEPADQPHPTPEAPSGRVVNGFQVCSAHDLAECPFCESDQR